MTKQKWKRRAKKLEKKKRGMQVTGRSIFTLQEIQKKKAEEVKKSPANKKR